MHDYNAGDLIACFDENIPESVIKAIAKKKPLRAVFRDSSFANSPSKINGGEIFKLLAPDTRVRGDIMGCIAYLRNEGKYSFFRFGKYLFKFRTSDRLVKYITVKEWDDGYIVVNCLHKNLGVVEDYIDLIPMLENLFLDADEILAPIRKVEIEDLGSVRKNN